jgi:hypothetical protein
MGSRVAGIEHQPAAWHEGAIEVGQVTAPFVVVGEELRDVADHDRVSKDALGRIG